MGYFKDISWSERKNTSRPRDSHTYKRWEQRPNSSLKRRKQSIWIAFKAAMYLSSLNHTALKHLPQHCIPNDTCGSPPKWPENQIYMSCAGAKEDLTPKLASARVSTSMASWSEKLIESRSHITLPQVSERRLALAHKYKHKNWS